MFQLAKYRVRPVYLIVFVPMIDIVEDEGSDLKLCLFNKLMKH